MSSSSDARRPASAAELVAQLITEAGAAVLSAAAAPARLLLVGAAVHDRPDQVGHVGGDSDVVVAGERVDPQGVVGGLAADDPRLGR
jgi:hypothetical protein